MATMKRYAKTTPTGTAIVGSCIVTNADSYSGTYVLKEGFWWKQNTAGYGSMQCDKAVYYCEANSKYLTAGMSDANVYPTASSNKTWDYLTFNSANEVTDFSSGWDNVNLVANETYSGTPETLFTVASGKAAAVVSIILNGGANGGTVNLYENNGTLDFSSKSVTLTANQDIVLDYKQFLEAGDSFKVGSASTGINVTVNVYEKDQA